MEMSQTIKDYIKANKKTLVSLWGKPKYDDALAGKLATEEVLASLRAAAGDLAAAAPDHPFAPKSE